MTSNRRTWLRARNNLADALVSLGYPEEFAGLLAKQLGNPKAIDRMTSWLYLARPRNIEMIVDETLAISAEIETWRKKKESREAQAGYSAWLNSKARMELQDEDE